ncbi:MAG: biotin/lipoyl-binding protein, partial [Huintestinicola sp.]
YSLPQVSAVYAQQGTVSEQIRGSGSVEAAESYEVKFDQTREVKTVAVKAGQEVKAGDLLFEFADAESADLVAAQDALAALELEYKDMLLDASDTSKYASEYAEIERKRQELSELKEQLIAAENKEDPLSIALDAYKTAKEQSESLAKEKEKYSSQLSSVSAGGDMLDLDKAYYDKMTAATTAVENAEKAAEEAQKKYDKLSAEAAESDGYETEYRSKQRAIRDKQVELDEAYAALYQSDLNDENRPALSAAVTRCQNDLNDLMADLADLQKKSTSNLIVRTKLKSAEGEVSKTQKELSAAKDKLNTVSREIKLELKNKIDSVDAKLTAVNIKLAEAETAKADAEAAGLLTATQLKAKITETENNLETLESTLETTLSKDKISDEKALLRIEAKEKEIEKQQAKVDKLKSESFDAKVTAKMGGIVSSVNVTAGSTAEAQTILAVINVSDSGYIVSFPVKKEQAAKVRVGDKAEITSWYWGNDFSATLAEIRADTQNPQTQKTLVFKVQGSDITTGQTITLSMGSKGQPYSCTVPNNAVREDSNGKFVLVMESKSSPFGNRYKAVRYDIEVLAKDDSHSAVNGLA